jgi:tetratricopeptide (TPR) repeat protein
MQDLLWAGVLQLRRYLIPLIFLLGIAFLAYTSAGKRLAQMPGFWPIAIFALGCWSLFTVARGFQNGRVEPIARGFYNTYERQTQPKRYWVSMAWNCALGLFCVSGSLLAYRQDFLDAYKDRCDNADARYSPKEALAACNKLIEKRRTENSPLLADAYWGRADARDSLHDLPGAIADYSQALRITPDSKPLLENRAREYLREHAAKQAIDDYSRLIELYPNDANGYEDRAFAYDWLLHERVRAIQDYSAAIAIKPDDSVALARRGLCYGRTGDYEHAVTDLTAVIRLRPNDATAYYFRSVGYHEIGDKDRAASDLATALRLNSKVVAQLERTQAPFEPRYHPS